MRLNARTSLIILCAVLAAPAANAQARMLVKTSQLFPLFWWTVAGTQITGDCELTNFTPSSRAITFAGSEPAHANPFSVPTCYLTTSPIGTQALAGQMDPRSLNDLGTYRITCHNIVVGIATPPCTTVPSWGACPGWTVCLNDSATPQGDAWVEIEVYNTPPSLSAISAAGSGLLGGNQLAYDASVDLVVSASDADGTGVTVSWVVESKPPTATGVLSTSGSNANLRMSGEADFGHWVIAARADDAQGERVVQRIAFDVVNQTPRPTVSGPTRVRVGDSIALTVTPDDDGGAYTSVRWQAVAPATSGWMDVGPAGAPLTFSMPTTRASLGTWRFRAVVTDADTPSLSGTSNELSVEVFNEPPMVAVTPPSPAVVGVGTTLTLSAEAVDSDGGPVRLQWLIVQAPAAAGASVGTPLGDPTPVESPAPRTFSVPLSAPGTWAFRAVATDDEGDTTRSDKVVVVADAEPDAIIRGAPSVVVGPGRFDLNDDSIDPDSYCATPSDPNRCHVVAAGESFTPLSDGIRRRLWSVESVPTELLFRYPRGPVAAAFHVPDSLQVLHFEEGQILPGVYRFRLDVEDSESNSTSTTITVRVQPPPMPPVAHVAMPARYLADATGRLMTDVTLDGTLSFDLDNATSFTPPPGLGITSYAWAVLPPAGCALAPSPPALPLTTLFTAGTVVPTSCFGVWTIQLTVGDDDVPQQFATREVDIVLGTCGTGVCIDRPTMARPQLVDPGVTISVPIYFYVDAAIYALPEYSSGFYAFIDVLPAGSTTPIYTLIDTSASGRPGALTTVTWHGETNTPGVIAPSGTYDLRLRIADVSLRPGPQVTETNAILIENATITIDPATATRFVRHQELEAGTATAEFSYTVNGSFGVTQVRSIIKRVGVGTAYDVTSDTTATAGMLFWNGHATDGSGPLLPPGDYEVEFSAWRSGRLVARSARYAFTTYRLGLGPAGNTDPVRVLLNSDDDNHDGVTDATQLNVMGEDDLVRLEVRVEPSTLAGELRVGAAAGSGVVALYTGATKSAALPASIARPATAIPQVWVEGANPGATDVTLSFVPTGRPALVAESRRVEVFSIEVLPGLPAGGPAPTPVSSLYIGRWDTGYDATNTVLNGADPMNFVDRDVRRFYVRVRDPAADTDPMARDTVIARIETRRGSSTFDPPTELVLTEDGASSGVFVSRSQLLTADDPPLVAGMPVAEGDDAFAADDGTGAPVMDESRGDRTHKVEIDSDVLVTYQPSAGAASLTQRVPVCGGLDERKRVPIRAWLWREPYDDLNMNGVFDGADRYLDLSSGSLTWRVNGDPMGDGGRGTIVDAAYVDQMMTRARIAWAQACIRPELVATMEVDAPSVGGVNILADGWFSDITGPGHPTLDTQAIWTANMSTPGFGTTALEIFFNGPNLGIPGDAGNAVSVIGASTHFSHGESTYAIVNSQLDFGYRTLGHELGHCLTNQFDPPLGAGLSPPQIFFPSNNTQPDHLGVSFRRRMSLTTETQARTVRPPGSVAATGNVFLQNL